MRLLKEAALYLRVDFDPTDLHRIEYNQRSYVQEELGEFKRDLMEAGRRINLIALEQRVPPGQLSALIQGSKECVATFFLTSEGIESDLLVFDKGKIRSLLNADATPSSFEQLQQEELMVFVLLPNKGVVSDFHRDDEKEEAPLSPTRRFIRLLRTERKDIAYVLLYAIIIGLVSLVLPLGLQNAIEVISGGVLSSSVYLLIGLVVFGLIFIGVLQLVQITMVEHLQRRIFAKAAFEFAYRIPRIRLEALTQNYAPELINRFFDIMTIQKGLPKVLLDLSAAAIQIFFGLLLLSAYHPFFVFFSILLITVLFAVFYFTGARGLKSSISESKYKYKVVQWLEEVARTIRSFKLAGNTDLAIKKTDYATHNYIKHRRRHFNTLLTQLSFFIFFKVAITGGLLIMGTLLVVDREITLGQFVASEVVIILVLNAVEKIILYMDVVYDLLTAVDKVSLVTDLPIEQSGGFDLPATGVGEGYEMALYDVCYQYPETERLALKNIHLHIHKGERICLAGPGGSGKSTLANIMAGLYAGYTGGVSVNGISMRDLDLTSLRDRVAKNISPEDIFDGTLYENVTIGKPTTNLSCAIEALEAVGLKKFIQRVPDGLNTRVLSGGKGLSGSVTQKLILARCLAKKPDLIILNDFFSELSKSDKLELIHCLTQPAQHWTLVAVSNDPLIMAACDRVVVLNHGMIVGDGTYASLLNDDTLKNYVA